MQKSIRISTPGNSRSKQELETKARKMKGCPQCTLYSITGDSETEDVKPSNAYGISSLSHSSSWLPLRSPSGARRVPFLPIWTFEAWLRQRHSGYSLPRTTTRLTTEAPFFWKRQLPHDRWWDYVDRTSRARLGLLHGVLHHELWTYDRELRQLNQPRWGALLGGIS